MTRGRWNPIAAFMALVANCNRNAEKQPEPFLPANFHPFRREVKEAVAGEVSMAEVKGIFVK
jgi:hypothetical protein